MDTPAHSGLHNNGEPPASVGLPAGPTNFFVANGDSTAGPYTVAELRARLASGALTLESLVCFPGWGEWRRVSEVPELAGLVSVSAANPAPPTVPSTTAPAEGRNTTVATGLPGLRLRLLTPHASAGPITQTNPLQPSLTAASSLAARLLARLRLPRWIELAILTTVGAVLVLAGFLQAVRLKDSLALKRAREATEANAKAASAAKATADVERQARIQAKERAEVAKSMAESAALEAARAQAQIEARKMIERSAIEARARRLEWNAKALLRAGYGPETVTNLLTKGGSVIAWRLDGKKPIDTGLSDTVHILPDGRLLTPNLLAQATKLRLVDSNLNRDFVGQSDVPDGLTGVVSVVASGNQTAALKSDGTVVEWGSSSFDSPYASMPSDLMGVVSIAMGPHHTMALKADGSVVAWGWKGLDTFDPTRVPPSLTGVVAIAAGEYHSVALRHDGTLVAWGRNEKGECRIPTRLSNVVAIAAGSGKTAAFKSDGTVVAWGDNTFYGSHVPPGPRGVNAVAFDRLGAIALKGDGEIASWGVVEAANYSYAFFHHPSAAKVSHIKQMLRTPISIATGGGYTVALNADGTVAAWTTSQFGNAKFPNGLQKVAAVAAGSFHGVAIILD